MPVLVVQGERDRFGLPRGSRGLGRQVKKIRGDHGLTSDGAALATALTRWLPSVPEPVNVQKDRP